MAEELEIVLKLDDGKVLKGFAKIGDAGKKAGDETGKSFDRAGKAATAAFKPLLVAFTALTGTGAAALKLFADFETGLTGVGKTVNLTKTELNALGKSFRDISREIPVSTKELLETAKVAGQLGIQGATDIETFTLTMAKFTRATGVAGEEAAAQLKRVADFTKLPIKNIENLASAVVDLGNNFNLQEKDLLPVLRATAQATTTYGLATQQVTALAGALTVAGNEAQISGTTLQTTLFQIEKAVNKGGKSLENFARVSGVSSRKFADTFRKDAGKALIGFVQGLGRVQKAGGSVNLTLAKLGLQEKRIVRVLGGLASQSDVLAAAMVSVNQQFEKSTALNKEFQTQIDTLSSDFSVLINNVIALGQELGSRLAPAARAVVKEIGEFIFFIQNDSGLLDFITNVGIAATALVGLAVSATGVIATLALLKTALVAIGVTAATTATIIKVSLISTGIGALIVAAGVLAVTIFEKWQFILDTTKAFAARFSMIMENLSAAFILALTGNFEEAGVAFDKFLNELEAGFNEVLKPEELAKKAKVAGDAARDALKNSAPTEGEGSTWLQNFQAGFALTKKDIEGQAKALGTNIRNSIGNGLGNAFAAFGGALAKGEDAFAAFGKTILGVFGDILIQLGTQMISAGLLLSTVPVLFGAQGPSAVIAGAAMAALGGVLKAASGGGGGGSTPGASASQPALATGPTSGAEFGGGFQAPEDIPDAAQVQLVVQGNIFNTDETARELAVILNDTISRDAVVV